MTRKHIASLAMAVLFTCTHGALPCNAQWFVTCVNCSDQLTQGLMHATNLEQLAEMVAIYEENVQQTIQQIELVANAVKQYENMVKNTIKLPAQMVNSVVGPFKDLADTVLGLQGMIGDVAAIGDLVEQIYGNPDFLKGVATAGRMSQPQKNSEYHAKVAEWSAQIETGCESVFKLTGEQLKRLTEDGDAFNDHVAELLSTPEGHMEAFEAANALAALSLDEARQLRAVITSSAQLTAEIQMKKERAEQFSAEMMQEFCRTDKLEGVSGKHANPDPF